MNSSRYQPHRHKRRPQTRAAFTLIEMVVALSITSILMVAIGSAMVVATKALPQGSSGTAAMINAGHAADRIAAELRYATSFAERTSTAVAFTVADRDNDAAPETIRYFWSGTPGDPLTRRYNGGTAVTVLDNVQQFNLAYDLKDVTGQVPGPDVEGAELELVSLPLASASANFTIKKNDWTGQYFQPALPPDAISWGVTRVLFKAKATPGPATGQTLVQLRPADANQLPTSTVLEQTTMFESSLSNTSNTWQEFAFNSVTGLAPGNGLCLVLEWAKDANAATIQYDMIGSGRVVTADGGLSWTNAGGTTMVYYVYGTVTAPGPTQTVTRQYLTAVRTTLQAGNDPSARIESAAIVLNAPQVTGP